MIILTAIQFFVPVFSPVILVLVNIYGMKLTVRVAMVFSTLKLLAIVFIIVVGIVTVIIRQCVPERLHHPFQPLEGHEPSVPSVALALYGVLWAYDAWYVDPCYCIRLVTMYDVM